MSQSLSFYICVLVLGVFLTEKATKSYSCNHYKNNITKAIVNNTDYIKNFCFERNFSSQCYDKAQTFKTEEMENLKLNLEKMGCK